MGLVGTSPAVFIGVTVLLMGFAAFMSGQALARTWRPMWQAVPYALLLGCADRFLVWALFGGQLWLISGYVVDTLVLLAICLVAYRLTLARRMARQYPWLFERSSLFTWRKKGES